MSTESWIKTKLGTVVSTSSGGTPSRSEPSYYSQGTIPWIRSGELEDNIITSSELKITKKGLLSSNAKILPAGTLLIAMYGATIGKMAFLGIAAATNQAVCSLAPQKGLLAHFLYYFLLYQRPNLIKKGIGGAQANISQTILRNLDITIPPLEIQERIVGKIEELFSEIDNGISALETAKRKLAVYRQVVITSAFPELSANNSVTLQEIAAISSGITKGRKLEGADILSLPYLRVANVQNGYLNLREIKEIQLKQSELARFLLEIDDVLYTEGGDRDKLGRGTVWRGEIPRCVHQNHIFKARLFKEKAVPQYVAYWSMTTPARNYFYEKGKQSVNLASINKTVLSKLPLPLPSLEKQSEIVSTIDQHMSVCNEIENTINKNLQAVAALKQSILKKAFEGNLL